MKGNVMPKNNDFANHSHKKPTKQTQKIARRHRRLARRLSDSLAVNNLAPMVVFREIDELNETR